MTTLPPPRALSRRLLPTILASLTLVAAAGPAVAECRLTELYRLPVTLDGNRPLVDVTVNGTPLKALVDTGAWRTTIIRSHAERLGLPLTEQDNDKVIAVGGYSKLYAAEVDEFTLGGLKAKDFRVAVTGERDTKSFQMILGQSLLAMHDLELDLANNVIRFVKAEGCANDGLAYWAGDQSVSVVTLKDLKNRDGTRKQAPSIVFDAEINGTWAEVKLDTGAFSSVVTLDAARMAGVTPESPGVQQAGVAGGLGAKSLDTWVATFDSLSIGGETVKRAKLRMADLFEGTKRRDTFDLLLGMDWIRAHRIYIAYGQGKMYFTYNGGPIFQTKGDVSDRPDEGGQPGDGGQP